MKTSPCVLFALLTSITPALATVTVTSPTNAATLTSPVHYVASATTTTCSKGVASMGVYVNNKLIYVVDAPTMNTEIAMSPGSQQTTVEEWDKCGGATVAHIAVTVEASAAPIVGITAKSSTITEGSSSVLTVTSVNSTAVTVTGSSGSVTAPTHTYSAFGTDTVTVVVSNTDGTSATTGTLTPSHTFAIYGTYTVTLTATDSAGHTAQSTTTVTVNSAGQSGLP